MDAQASDDGVSSGAPPVADGGAAGPAAIYTADAFRKLTERLRTLKSEPTVPDEAPDAAAAKPADPEPEPAPAGELPLLPAPRDPAAEAGEAALRMLDLMVASQGLLPHERTLAADSLLLLLPRMASPQLVKLAERVAIMDPPPPLISAMLIRDPRPEVMAPVLERSLQLSDRDLIEAAPLDDIERLRIVARRRVLSPEVSRHLVASGDPAVILALLRNPDCQLAPQTVSAIAALAAEHPALLPPLVTRPELPAAVAFDLYWSLPSELRRLLLSRFLTDSVMLGRILRMTLAQDEGLAAGAFREERGVAAEDLDAAIDAAAEGQPEDASRMISGSTGLAEATVRRILGDPQGEALGVLFKAMEVNRQRVLAATGKLRASGVLAEPAGEDQLLAVFESLSFTKARVLVIYWDWSARKAGPHAPVPAGEAPQTLVESVPLA